MLDYSPAIIIACPLIACFFSLLSSMCAFAASRVCARLLSQGPSAIPQIYPFWLLLSVGIFTGLESHHSCGAPAQRPMIGSTRHCLG